MQQQLTWPTTAAGPHNHHLLWAGRAGRTGTLDEQIGSPRLGRSGLSETRPAGCSHDHNRTTKRRNAATWSRRPTVTEQSPVLVLNCHLGTHCRCCRQSSFQMLLLTQEWWNQGAEWIIPDQINFLLARCLVSALCAPCYGVLGPLYSQTNDAIM